MKEVGLVPEYLNNTRFNFKDKFVNTGEGITLLPIDIRHPEYMAIIDPDTAFWALVRKENIPEVLCDTSYVEQYGLKREKLYEEMKTLRFGLKTTAVYFNPTEKCNLNCTYCYIPEHIRRSGIQMSKRNLLKALDLLKDYFESSLPEERKPEIIFHGSEPMLNKDAIFEAIEKYKHVFNFGIQTNGTLLDRDAIDFLKFHEIGIGLSLDGHQAEICDKTRRTWSGKGIFKKVVSAIEYLNGYHKFNVICTVSSENVPYLTEIVKFFHELEVPSCMLNPIRCTQPGSRDIKPSETMFAHYFINALDSTYQLFQMTGRKLIVANFANVMVAILAPLARKLMCDISPCGAGRCFFAVGADGSLYPCSEFIGLPEFNGGNIFEGEVKSALESMPFQIVTNRIAERINHCKNCAIRNFCGSPCPAEAYSMKGDIMRRGAFCEFYEEQVRYAFRQIAEGRESCFLWDDWDRDTETTLNISV